MILFMKSNLSNSGFLRIILLQFLLLNIVSCKDEEVEPLDLSNKLIEIHLGTSYAAIIVNFYYDLEGRLESIYEADNLRYKFYYTEGIVSRIEYLYGDGTVGELFEFKYNGDRVSEVTYANFSDSYFEYRYYYEYQSDTEFVRLDSLIVPQKELVATVTFTLNQIHYETYHNNEPVDNLTINVSYSGVPNFFKIFNLSQAPLLSVYNLFGFTAFPSELLQVSEYLPSGYSYGDYPVASYSYEFNNGAIRKIIINPNDPNISQEVRLFWEK